MPNSVPETLAVVALVAGIALGAFWLVDAPVVNAVPTGFPVLHLELPPAGFLVEALEAAIGETS